MKGYEQIKRAYLVQKIVTAFPEKPFYVLGIIPKYAWYQRSNPKAELDLVKTLSSKLKFTGHTLIVMLTRKREHLRPIFRRIENSEVFRY